MFYDVRIREEQSEFREYVNQTTNAQEIDE